MQTVLVAAIAALVAGCAEDPAAAAPSPPASTSPVDLRAAIDADLGNVLTQTQAAIEATTTGLPGAMSATTLAQLFGASAGAAQQLTSPLASRLALPGGAASFVAWLDANVFSSSIDDGIYAIPAALVCPQPVATDCAAQVAAAQPRVRVAASANGVALFVQLGTAHDEPIAITLTSAELTASIDLDAAGRDLGAPFAGTAILDLDIVGASHVIATATIGAPITVGWGGASLTSATGTPLTIDLDGSRPQIAATLALGATTIELADTVLALAGATVTVGFDGHTLTLDRISLGSGSATLAKAGAQAIAIDVNPDADRSFGAVLSLDGDGVETLAVAPSLEIRQSIDHAVLGDVAPVYDVTDLALDAALHGAASADQVEVVHGTLAVATAPTSYGVVGTDARCVTQTPATASTGETYDQLAVATCQ
jgi:hypothetical protein